MFSENRKKIFCTVAAGLLIVVAAAFLLWSVRPNKPQPAAVSPGNAAPKEPVSVTGKAPGWWESRRLIYFGIPARLYFHLPDADKAKAEKTARKAWDEFARIGKIFDPSDPDSETGRLNAADKTVPVAVSDDMFAVLKLSKRLWEATGGAFDPTVSPVKKLWQDAVKSQQIPTERQVQKVLSHAGFGHVKLLPEQKALVCDIQGIKLDFGGIAKGFAVDRVCGLLKDSGIADGLVQLGGEIAAFGSNRDGPWRIGIQHPADMEEIWGIVSAAGPVRVSTSGNYRQPLIIQGHRFYHIFSPQTGKPVPNKVLGVTTAGFGNHVSSALLDGAATAIAVSGVQRGMDLAEKLGIEILVLTRNGENEIREHITPLLSGNYEPAALPSGR